jgi:hypothetical protein
MADHVEDCFKKISRDNFAFAAAKFSAQLMNAKKYLARSL